jgi:hypothetical protein
MIQLSNDLTTQISGGSYFTADYTHTTGPSNSSYDCMHITFPTDGSLPKDFQDRIDSGASWEEIAPFLIMYSMIYELHPEFFQ